MEGSRSRRRRRSRWSVAAVHLPVLVLAAAPLDGQDTDAVEVVQAALEHHRERAEGIAKLVQEVRFQGTGDRSVTLELVRDTVAGVPVFVPEGRSGAAAAESTSSDRLSEGPVAFLARFGGRMARVGTDTVDGRRTHVLALTDFAGTTVDSVVPLAGGLIEDFTPEELRLHLDADSYVPRRMAFEGTMVQRGTERPFRYDVRFRDYRTVDGWLHPFLQEGATETGFSDAERLEMERMIERMRSGLEDAPPERREQLREAIERMEQVASGRLAFRVETTALEVVRE